MRKYGKEILAFCSFAQKQLFLTTVNWIIVIISATLFYMKEFVLQDSRSKWFIHKNGLIRAASDFVTLGRVIEA